MDLSRAELASCASFDDSGFQLQSLPEHKLADVPLGRYELPRRSEEAHIYRPGHPLAIWAMEQAKSRQLPVANLHFDYDAYGSKVSTLEPYRGKGGWLTVRLLTVKALGAEEQHLMVAAVTADGEVLEAEDPEKLLRLPAREQTTIGTLPTSATLDQDLTSRRDGLLRDINHRNLGFFKQEVDKLEAWADDLKLRLEAEIKQIDAEIKEAVKAAAVAATLPETLEHQERRSTLQKKRGRLIAELFTRQDEIANQRDELIGAIKGQLQQDIQDVPLFTISWTLA
jgi:hypothetical protein